MRVIHKKLSLNEFRSRTDSIVPVIMDAWTVTDPCGIVSAPYSSYTDALDAAFGMNLNEASISYSAISGTVHDKAQYNYCNYGMIPLTISGDTVISFHTLNEMYLNGELSSEYGALFSGGTLPDGIAYAIPEMSIDLMLTTSIDDLGQMSIISEDYQEGVDYGMVANTEGGSTMGYNSYSGTGAVVNMVYTYEPADTLSNEIKYYGLDTYILNDPKQDKASHVDDEIGYIVSGDGWSSYTDRYVGEIANRLYDESVESSYTTQMHEFSTCCGDDECCGYVYSPISRKIENICPIPESATTMPIDIVSGDIFVIDDVIYPVNSGTVVVTCDGVPIHHPIMKEGDIEYFIHYGKRYMIPSSTGTIGCDGCSYSASTEARYIIYNSKIKYADGDSIILSSVTDSTIYVYHMLNGYFDVDGDRLYIEGDNVVTLRRVGDTKNNVVEFVVEPFSSETYVIDINSKTVTYDFEPTSATVVSGYCGSKLQLLRRTEITVDELGNELPGYFDNSGSTYNNPYMWCELDPLYMIGNVSELMATGEENHYIGNIISDINKSDDVWEITYYLGADIEYNESSGFTYNSGGVMYVDTINVEYSAVTDYYMADGSSFPVYYTKFGTNLQSIHNDDYDSDINMNMAYFEYTPECYSERRDYMVAPVYRNEFDLTTSLPQNIEGDIYIDRGISSAFERHLKLQEIRSMTSLENYGNAWFKINDF